MSIGNWRHHHDILSEYAQSYPHLYIFVETGTWLQHPGYPNIEWIERLADEDYNISVQDDVIRLVPKKWMNK